MILKSLNDQELNLRVKNLCMKERQILHDLLLTLKEVESRRSYLAMGYSSLFEYLVNEIKCDGGMAQRRIDAVRLMMDVPVVADKIQSGELSLNKVSLIQQACREMKRSRDITVSANDKKELVAQILDKDLRSSQKEVAQFFDMPVAQVTKQKVQADESVRVELTLSKELAEKIKKAQEFLSHSLQSQDLVQYLEFVTDKVLRQKNTKAATSARNESVRQSEGSDVKERARFSVKIRKEVIKKHNSCQFVDPITKRQCNSKWFLQVDHIQPLWADGKGHKENAQVLCAAHNKYKYKSESGTRLTS